MALGKVLVTGAPGWLGIRLVQTLAREGIETRCLVLAGSDTSVLTDAGAEVVEGDVLLPGTLAGAVDGVDTVFHAAGIIHTGMFSLGNLDRVNAGGTQNLLEAAVRAGVRRFVYVSSNSAAGCNRRRDVLMNEYTPPRPYMRYGWSKSLAERAVNEAWVREAIETTILRPCWYYGPGQPERQTRLMKMITLGKAPLFGDGANLRSMTFVDSLCDALVLAAETDVARGETYWIADERPYSTLEIYRTLADILGVELRTSTYPAFASAGAALVDGVLQRVGLYQMEIHVAGEMYKDIACSVAKAKKDLGWRSPTDLRDGMAESVEWARDAGLL
ncbi:MAG: NAD-dependent epimerase/dehydratase family protein [Coriobacteriia bacterium]